MAILKDTFRNLIFCIDKVVTFGIVNLTQPTKLSFSEGGVDGERPLKFLSYNLNPHPDISSQL